MPVCQGVKEKDIMHMSIHVYLVNIYIYMLSVLHCGVMKNEHTTA